MNIKAYIESGVLEAYVLGSLTAQEQKEVQANIARYVEVAVEVKAIEESMLSFARSVAVQPPPGLHNKIWNALNVTPNTSSGSAPAVKVLPLAPDGKKRGQWKYAAMVAILIGSLAFNFLLWQQARNGRDERTALHTRMEMMQTHQNQLLTLLTQYEIATTMMADTAMQTIVMHTMVKGHPMAATFFWHKANGDSYVAMEALPPPPAGMQYQLWVVQNGKPVSMGTLPGNMANSPATMKVAMKVTAAEAFAISLEKEGGSATPTTIYVMGKA